MSDPGTFFRFTGFVFCSMVVQNAKKIFRTTMTLASACNFKWGHVFFVLFIFKFMSEPRLRAVPNTCIPDVKSKSMLLKLE